MRQEEKNILQGIFLNGFEYKCANPDELVSILRSLSIEDIFGYIKENASNIADIRQNDIPQFSNYEDVFMVLRVLSDSPEQSLNWEKIGYYMCPKDASVGAKTKYGENHYKLAVQLGLAYPGHSLMITPLGRSIHDIKDVSLKEKVVARLILRIPIIQKALLEAEKGRFNMLECLKHYLSESTAIRRRSNIKKLLSIVESNCTKQEMYQLIWNIVWSDTDELS